MAKLQKFLAASLLVLNLVGTALLLLILAGALLRAGNRATAPGPAHLTRGRHFRSEMPWEQPQPTGRDKLLVTFPGQPIRIEK